MIAGSDAKQHIADAAPLRRKVQPAFMRWERATLPSPKRSRFGFAQAGPMALMGCVVNEESATPAEITPPEVARSQR